MILLQQMMILAVLMMLGFVLAKKEKLTPEVGKSISWMIVNIANPAVILSSSIGDHTGVSMKDMKVAAGVALCSYAVLIFLGEVVFRVLPMEQKKRGTYKGMLVFSNIGFMGIPIVQSLFEASAVIYTSLFMVVFNLLLYTYGVASIQSGGIQKIRIKEIMNTGVIACLLALVLFFGQISLPEGVQKLIQMLSNLTAPLSMMVIGSSMVGLRPKDILQDTMLIFFSIIKLIAIPLIGFVVIRHFSDNRTMIGVCLVMLSTPVASLVPMLAKQYDGEEQTAVKGVTLTTILSVITMPLVFMIAGY